MKRLFILLAAATMAAGVMATEYIGLMQMASGYRGRGNNVKQDGINVNKTNPT